MISQRIVCVAPSTLVYLSGARVPHNARYIVLKSYNGMNYVVFIRYEDEFASEVPKRAPSKSVLACVQDIVFTMYWFEIIWVQHVLVNIVSSK